MSMIRLTQASSGAPTLSGTSGKLVDVLDWALVQQGWAIEYSTGNNRVYRPGTGRRRRLYISHDNSVSGNDSLAVIRGCEDASGALMANLIDPFPQEAQVAQNNSNIHISTSVGATAKDYTILLTETFIIMMIRVSGANNWSMWFFGDVPSNWPGDVWNTAVMVRNSNATTDASTATTGIGGGHPWSMPTTSPYGNIYFARSVDGLVKSTKGGFAISCNSTGSVPLGAITGMPAARGGFENRLPREKVYLHDGGVGGTGSAVATSWIARRAVVPYLWNPMCLNMGPVASLDTFTDTAYNPAALFVAYSANVNGAAGFCILEETDTWSP